MFRYQDRRIARSKPWLGHPVLAAQGGEAECSVGDAEIETAATGSAVLDVELAGQADVFGLEVARIDSRPSSCETTAPMTSCTPATNGLVLQAVAKDDAGRALATGDLVEWSVEDDGALVVDDGVLRGGSVFVTAGHAGSTVVRASASGTSPSSP
jgi:hypothetical protein